jgi:hypothetical protein
MNFPNAILADHMRTMAGKLGLKCEAATNG